MIRRLTLTVAIAAAVAVVAPALAGAMPIQGPPSLGGPTSKTIQHPTELQANSLYRISNSKANEAFGFLAQPDNQIVTEHSPSQNRVDAVNAALPAYRIATQKNRFDAVNTVPAGSQVVTEHSLSQNRVDAVNADLCECVQPLTHNSPMFSSGSQVVTEHSLSQNRVDAVNAAQAVPSEWQSYEAYLTKRANVHPVMGATGRPYEAYLESRGDAAATSSPTITENSASSDGFNWSDARLGGASAAIGAFVLLFGAALVLIRRRGRLAV
jgi:hypothetical protein